MTKILKETILDREQKYKKLSHKSKTQNSNCSKIQCLVALEREIKKFLTLASFLAAQVNKNQESTLPHVDRLGSILNYIISRIYIFFIIL